MFASKDVFLKSGAGGYTIARSVRLRSSATAYLSRTPASASNRTTWTWSSWVKFGLLTGNQTLFEAQNGTTFSRISIDGNLNLACQGGTSNVSTTFNVATSAVIRDPSSWYHFVVAFDTTQATAANRVKLYINGVQLTALATANYPTQNSTWSWNASCLHNIGRYVDSTFGAGGYADVYLAEMNFVDGQQLTQSSFGAISTNGVWQPARYTGTYGTNGFYLKFADNSTAAALGTDSSGNSNTWTVNNINVTAYSGTPADNTSYDSMTDVPTLTSATAANYAVLNAAAPAPGSTSITNGNLSWAQTAASLNRAAIATFGMSSGKWYWECAVGASIGANNSLYFGIAQGSFTLTNYCGATTTSWGYTSGSGNKVTNGSGTAYGATFTSNDVIGFAFDADAGTITAYKNGASQGTMFTGLTSGPYFAVVSESIGGGGTANLIRSMNFGQRPFTSTPPTGFVALNTYNLSTPTIANGAAYMAATLYTGTGAALTVANTVNGTSFQPDFVWVKGRSGATDHALYDSVRGTTKDLASNTTAAETTQATGLTAFGSTGFTVGALAKMNTSSATYVGWQWLAGAGTSSSNTNGSITSTVSVNATAGFSVVTYTGTGANATVGHGLGVAPSMVIVKGRSNTFNWGIWHTAFAGTDYVLLNLTNAKATLATIWNSTVPTSSVISVGTDVTTNQSSATYVAYCFAAVAGYSAFGSYTGNGSTDGPFVYLGFRPRWVMVKRTDSTSDWYIWDTSRDTYNVVAATLLADTSGAETSATSIDDLSNGFKCRSATVVNVSTGTYIYAAFAENPFKYSLAR